MIEIRCDSCDKKKQFTLFPPRLTDGKMICRCCLYVSSRSNKPTGINSHNNLLNEYIETKICLSDALPKGKGWNFSGIGLGQIAKFIGNELTRIRGEVYGR